MPHWMTAGCTEEPRSQREVGRGLDSRGLQEEVTGEEATGVESVLQGERCGTPVRCVLIAIIQVRWQRMLG